MHAQPQYKLSSRHAIIFPVFVVQNPQFVSAHAKDQTYRLYCDAVVL